MTDFKERVFRILKRCRDFCKRHARVCTTIICIILLGLIFLYAYGLTQGNNGKSIALATGKQITKEAEKDIKKAKEISEKAVEEAKKKEEEKTKSKKGGNASTSSASTSTGPSSSSGSSGTSSGSSSGYISSRAVYASNRSVIHQPSQSVFGEYYDYAMQVYNYVVNGTPIGSRVFASKNDFNIFRTNLARTVFQDSKVPTLDTWGMAFETPMPNGGYNYQIIQEGRIEYLNRIITENLILSICGTSTTDKGVIDSLNNWLIRNTTYGGGNSIDAVVFHKRSRCNGFTEFIQFACNMYGIPNATQLNPSGDHIWNRVQIGGTWYYIDTTWNVCDKANNYYLSRTIWGDHYD